MAFAVGRRPPRRIAIHLRRIKMNVAVDRSEHAARD